MAKKKVSSCTRISLSSASPRTPGYTKKENQCIGLVVEGHILPFFFPLPKKTKESFSQEWKRAGDRQFRAEGESTARHHTEGKAHGKAWTQKWKKTFQCSGMLDLDFPFPPSPRHKHPLSVVISNSSSAFLLCLQSKYVAFYSAAKGLRALTIIKWDLNPSLLLTPSQTIAAPPTTHASKSGTWWFLWWWACIKENRIDQEA